MQDIIRLPNTADIMNSSAIIGLYEAIEILNANNHNGFNCWVYIAELNAVLVGKSMNISNIYYYSLTESQAILIAKNYKDKVYKV